MELPPDLKQALERLRAGITDTADLETLRRALQVGQIVLATGERAVAIGGSVEDTVIVTVDNNIVFKGATAESVREALQQVLERIASDRYAAFLQAYFRALRRYCAELPYLTLTDIRPPKNLDEIYVPLRARQREKETLPPKPAAQGASLTVEQVLRQAQTSHLLILGQPGAGKSTLLRQLAERAYDAPHAIGLDRPHLPLLLPLRALAHAEGALEERLNQALQNELRLPRPLPDGFLDAWPQQLDTPWLFLLDGLDEVPADSSRSLRQWIATCSPVPMSPASLSPAVPRPISKRNGNPAASASMKSRLSPPLRPPNWPAAGLEKTPLPSCKRWRPCAAAC